MAWKEEGIIQFSSKENPTFFIFFSGKIENIKIPFQQKDAKFHLRSNHMRTEDETSRRKEKKFNTFPSAPFQRKRPFKQVCFCDIWASQSIRPINRALDAYDLKAPTISPMAP